MRYPFHPASATTIAGIAGMACGLYCFLAGKISISGLGAVASFCMPLVTIRERNPVPTVNTGTGTAVPVTTKEQAPHDH